MRHWRQRPPSLVDILDVAILWICEVSEELLTSTLEYLELSHRHRQHQVLSCLLEVELKTRFGQLQSQKSQQGTVTSVRCLREVKRYGSTFDSDCPSIKPQILNTQ